MKPSIKLFSLFTYTFICISSAEIIRYQDLSWSTDIIRNGKETALSNSMIAHLETAFMSAEDLAKKCSTGIRISVKISHFKPTQLVVLNDYKSNLKLQPIPCIGWREYSHIDTNAMTLNRTTKVLDQDSLKNSPKLIGTSDLWKVLNQEEIPDFNLTYNGGDSVIVELFADGKFKKLVYSNPSLYPQKQNLEFRKALHNLLTELKIETSGIVYLKPDPSSEN
ncbi:hypothetical protein [Rubritalea tangerina]|uniref:POTRA domain-containing protein n=1 Tax=Rubritalea tangerina TaxID=430798 RepID=A0ABW4Z921_9BACT